MNVEETKKSFQIRYGRFYLDNLRDIRLDQKNVPIELVELIPYAEFWGSWGIINDEKLRDELLDNCPKAALLDLTDNLDQYDEELDFWLAGEESEKQQPSEEFVAFSAMRMLADFAF